MAFEIITVLKAPEIIAEPDLCSWFYAIDAEF